jgi:hypothetical protein
MYVLFITFILLGPLEEAHQRNMRWNLPPIIDFSINRGKKIYAKRLRRYLTK